VEVEAYRAERRAGVGVGMEEEEEGEKAGRKGARVVEVGIDIGDRDDVEGIARRGWENESLFAMSCVGQKRDPVGT